MARPHGSQRAPLGRSDRVIVTLVPFGRPPTAVTRGGTRLDTQATDSYNRRPLSLASRHG